MPLTDTDLDRMLTEARVKAASAWDTMKRAELGRKVDTGNAGPLTIVNASWGKRPDLAHLGGDDLVAALNDIDYVEVVLSSDGQYVPSDVVWERDEPNIDIETWVYYERWTAEGMVAHGYVHPETRRLVQSG